MQRRHRSSWTAAWAITMSVPLLIAATIAAARGGAQERIDPAADRARLLRVQGGYAVWLVSELHPETAGHRAQTFTHRLYRQRLDEAQGKLVFEYVGTAGARSVAIRDDGSILLFVRRSLDYITDFGHAVQHDVPWYNLVALYPDGALFKDMSVRHPKQFQSVYFVPFEGDRLHADARVDVVQEGVKNFIREDGLGYPGEPYRFGETLAWAVDSTLHTFDLKNHERTSVKLAADLHPSYGVTAFDGSTVVCGIYAFNAATGKLLGEPDYTKRPKNVAAVFAVRNRIGYYYDSGSLRATDLSSREGASVEVCHTEPIVPMQNDEGLTIWDGKRWRLVPWFTDLRRPGRGRDSPSG